MSFIICVLISAILILSCSCQHEDIRVTDGRYAGIVVGIGPDVPESQADAVIDSIKKLINSGSLMLNNATRGALTFGEVTIVVPRTWQSSRYAAATGAHHSYSEAALRITRSRNPLYGDGPYTLQARGCGQPGEYVHLTTGFLLNWTEASRKYGDPARVLVHEWAHYRWGVFDEYGYRGDQYYPPVYHDGFKLQPTGCSDVEVNGEMSDACDADPTNSDCWFYPESNQTLQRSSLMYLHYLPEVTQFCDSSNHNRLAPTKQNLLCGGKSVWEVMMQHQDFHGSFPASSSVRPVHYNIVRPSNGRYVLVMDLSANMNDFVKSSPRMQRINFLHAAGTRFVMKDVPDGSSLALIGFGGEAQVLKSLNVVNSDTRNGFANSLRRFTYEGQERNPIAALRKAMQELDTGTRTDGIIAIITNGKADRIASYMYSQLRDELKRRRIRVIAILFPPPGEPNELPSLAEATGGRNIAISEVGAGDKGNASTYAQLCSALAEVITSHTRDEMEDRITLYEKVHLVSEAFVSGTFPIDTGVGHEVVVAVLYYSRQSIFSLQLTSPDGTTYGSDDYFDNDREKTIEFRLSDKAAVLGSWSYEIRTNRHDDQPVTVTVTSRPMQRGGQSPIVLRAWTSAGNIAANASVTPVAIYASLRRDNAPIINARVKAYIERPKVNNSYSVVELDLLDNGNGGPDITKDDGVYSRYFTEFVYPSSGLPALYTVTVKATDNDGRAQVISTNYITPGPSAVMPIQSDVAYCCGSDTTSGSDVSADATGTFMRSATASGTLIISEPPPQHSDMFPPSTVLDLRVESVDEMSGKITLSWTAPGDDLDKGQVSSYALRYASERALLSESKFGSAPPVYQSIIPEPAGSVQRVSFFPPLGRNVRYFFAIQAYDKIERNSSVSNIISVVVPPEPTTSPPPSAAETGSYLPENGTYSTGRVDISSREPLLNAEIIAIVVGSTLAVLLILMIIVIYFVCLAKRRRQKEKSNMKPAMNKSPNGSLHGVTVTAKTTKSPEYINGKALSNGKDFTYPPSGYTTSDSGVSRAGPPVNAFPNPDVFHTPVSQHITAPSPHSPQYQPPSNSINPNQFMSATELLTNFEKRQSHCQSVSSHHILPPPAYYYHQDDGDSIHKQSIYNQYTPQYHHSQHSLAAYTTSPVIDTTGGHIDCTSLSSNKPPSSYGSHHTAGSDHHRPDGFVNSSYDDASDNSTETSRLRASITPPLLAGQNGGTHPIIMPPHHPPATPKRVLSESQV